MAAPIQELIEHISDGFVLLSEAGEARYANSAARTALGEGLKKLATAPELKAAVSANKAGSLKLPAEIKLELDGSRSALNCTVIHAPVGATLALLVKPHAHAKVEAGQPALTNVLELIRGQLLRPVQSLTNALEHPDEDANPETTLQKLREVGAELGKLVEFAAVFGEDQLNAADRVVIKDLVSEVWRDIAAHAAARSIEVSMTGFGHELPPIYGNLAWLRSIVRELIDNAIRHSKSRPMAGSNQKSQLEISARQMGPHVVLHIRNAGVGVLPKIADRVFLPFNTASASGRGQAKGLSIGLPLVHKLVELHGGKVRIDTDGEDFTECVVELPTGAPRHDMSKLDLQQAKRYAEDIGKLMARRKKKAA